MLYFNSLSHYHSHYDAHSVLNNKMFGVTLNHLCILVNYHHIWFEKMCAHNRVKSKVVNFKNIYSKIIVFIHLQFVPDLSIVLNRK